LFCKTQHSTGAAPRQTHKASSEVLTGREESGGGACDDSKSVSEHLTDKFISALDFA